MINKNCETRGAGRFDFAALQDGLRSGPARPGSGDLAASAPATFVVFDLLTRYGTDLHDPQHEPP